MGDEDGSDADNPETGHAEVPRRLRVRELAKRFEAHPKVASPDRRCSTKRIGKFRVLDNGQMFRISQQPVKIGVVRKKSSLKRRSRSSHEVTSSLRQRASLKKSASSNFPHVECRLFEQNDDLAVETNSPILRSRGEKPQPPAKPARLYRTVYPEQQEQYQSEPPTTSARFTLERDTQPTYRERATVALTITEDSNMLSRPQFAPPPPPKPPSRARLSRIPSHLTPLTKPTVTKVRRKSSSEDDFYQKLPSPTKDSESCKLFQDSQTTEKNDIPRIPSIPPPLPPQSSKEEYSDDSLCYEQIDSTNECEVRMRCLPSAPSTSADTGSYSNYTYVTNIYCDNENSRCSSDPFCPCSKCSSRRSFSLLPTKSVDVMSMSTNTDHFETTTLNRKNNSRRPSSSLELDKLFRFKSELQLNISKKVGQFRQRVGERRSRVAKCHLRADELETDGQIATREDSTSRDLDDDRYIYGDDWSSEEDERNVFDDRRSSMYKELEEQLNKTFPVGRMSSESEYESVDVVPDTATRPDQLVFGGLSLEENKDEPSPDECDYVRQYTSRLTMDQPLYQIYMMEEHEKLIDDVNSHDTTEELARADDSEERERKIKSRRESSASSDSGRGADCSTSASALTSNTSMRRERLIASSHFGSQRSLWCELPEVKSAGLLDTLDEETKIRQEAYFEVITSEASYLRSLNILITHFMASQELMGSKSSLSVITNAERKHLFSNIFAVRDCSERLLCDLETRLEENLVLDDLCDFLVDHFEKNFDVYVKYCSNQVYQDRTLRRLKSENNNFLSAVSRLEADKQCQGLDMRSFLMLPMQRVTRYPLLMYAIIDRLPIDSERYKVASRALNAANKVVRECNEGARRMERTEQLLEVDRRLVYKDPDLKRIPLVSNSRHLVKRGPLVQLIERRTKGILQARQKSRGLHIFLFSDIIMITKKRLNGTYECKDYAARRYVDVEPIEAGNTKIPSGALSSLTSCPHLFICILMRNARGKHTELLFNADSETDRERWLSAIRPPTSLNPEEKVYAEWDCPQAIAVHNYSKNQDDELDVQVGDTVNILRKMPDGWFYGERTRDGAGGWFPSSYVQQILNDHVRANNYRQRLRLIQAASGVSTRSSVSGRGTTPLMDRLRRMSNPRSFFQSGTVGL